MEINIDNMVIPDHIAIILDGNGRWAKKRGLPRSMGHKEGCVVVERTVEDAARIGIKYLTVYGFSTENWKRPLEEVSAIVGLLKKYLLESIEKMEKDKIKLHFFGDLEPLPQELKDMCRKTSEISERYEGMQVNVCFNYGGRDEIVRAARHFAADCAAGGRKPEELTEVLFSEYLCSNGVPDPDLVIRPSGEVRISNFLLWQSAYAEFYFTDVLWPDFSKEELHRALAAYQGRSRRFGGV